jgi:hypothetical protein
MDEVQKSFGKTKTYIATDCDLENQRMPVLFP